MNETIRPLPARLVIALATLLGGGSLLLFGAFLFVGPLGLIDLGLDRGQVLAWDAALCLAFCAQHSVMVRRGFRQRVERIVPPYYYSAIYAVASGVVLLALTMMWQEYPVIVMKAEGAARWLARVVFLAAIPGFLWGARSIPRFDPLGVGPIKARLSGREPQGSPFAVRGPYRWVRHPQYFFSLVLIWWYPDLTADRLLLNVILTVWIVLGTILEERDLVLEFGDDYATYQRHVPILLPWRPPWAP
jgi:protein-S-isoprenylcysteine O-methyltransferase Ste14